MESMFSPDHTRFIVRWVHNSDPGEFRIQVINLNNARIRGFEDEVSARKIIAIAVLYDVDEYKNIALIDATPIL